MERSDYFDSNYGFVGEKVLNQITVYDYAGRNMFKIAIERD